MVTGGQGEGEKGRAKMGSLSPALPQGKRICRLFHIKRRKGLKSKRFKGRIKGKKGKKTKETPSKANDRGLMWEVPAHFYPFIP